MEDASRSGGERQRESPLHPGESINYQHAMKIEHEPDSTVWEETESRHTQTCMREEVGKESNMVTGTSEDAGTTRENIDG